MAFPGGKGQKTGRDESEGIIEANPQPITLAQFQILLDLSTKYMVNEIRKAGGLSYNKDIPDTFEATVLQNLTETVCLEEKLTAEPEDLLQVSVEGVMENFQNNNEESLENLDFYNLKGTLLDPPTQKLEKYQKNAGAFKIKKKMTTGTLQFLYKNGLLNLLKENCVLLEERDTDDTHPQLENQDFLLINPVGGSRLRKKKFRKKVKEKEEREKGRL